jgi:hypothetical protein
MIRTRFSARLTDPALPESAVITPPQLHHDLGHDPSGLADDGRMQRYYDLCGLATNQ